MERNQARQWNNRHIARKGKENLSQFIDNMILYEENTKESTKRLLELRNRFSKVAGYKVNRWKSNAFIYTYSEQSENEIQ